MATLSDQRIRELVTPYVGSEQLSPQVIDALGTYLDLLVRWNAKTNLTAIRRPEEMVERHFGESLFAGFCLRPHVVHGAEVLDLGSGAGFPGIPVQLLLPQVRVTLAESQGKKAAFLREAVRVLGLSTEVWAARVESMPPERRFEAVMLRAVDQMSAMVEVGRSRLLSGGVLLEMGSESQGGLEVHAMPRRDGSWVRLSRVD